MTHFHDYPDFEPVLHCALAHKDIASALLLLQKGADINVRDSFGHTPLLIAVKYGEAGMVALLLKPGANIHVRDNFLPCSTSMTTAQIKAYRGPTLLQLAREAISSSKINARILRRMKISRPIGQRLADRMVLSTDAQKDYETIIALLKQAGENE